MSSTSFTEGMSETKVYVNDAHQLKQVSDRVGCIINLASKSYTFPTTVTVYGFTDKEEMSFKEFEKKYLS